MSRPHSRIFYLDYLRTALILLIVVEHASWVYTSHPVFNYFDCKRSTWFLIDSMAQNDALFNIVSFRLSFAIPLLFFISGLFFDLSLRRRGVSEYIKHRLVRIGIPVLLIAFLIMPLMYYLTCSLLWKEFNLLSFLGYYFSHGRWYLLHGWFLWTLLVFEAIALSLRSLSGRSYEGFCRFVQRFTLKPIGFLVTVLAASYLAYFVGALLIQPKFLLFWEIVTGPFFFIAHNLFISLLFFVLGVSFGYVRKSSRFEDLERALPSSPLIWFFLSAILFAVQVVMPTAEAPSLLSLRNPPYVMVNLITTPLLVVTLSLTALSLFRKYLNFPSALLKNLSAASYTIYVLHPPICIWTEYLLLPLRLPLFAKLTISVLAGVLGSWAIYILVKSIYNIAPRGRLLFGRSP